MTRIVPTLGVGRLEALARGTAAGTARADDTRRATPRVGTMRVMDAFP